MKRFKGMAALLLVLLLGLPAMPAHAGGVSCIELPIIGRPFHAAGLTFTGTTVSCGGGGGVGSAKFHAATASTRWQARSSECAGCVVIDFYQNVSWQWRFGDPSIYDPAEVDNGNVTGEGYLQGWSYSSKNGETAYYAWDGTDPHSGWRSFQNGLFERHCCTGTPVGAVVDSINVWSHIYAHVDGSSTTSTSSSRGGGD